MEVIDHIEVGAGGTSAIVFSSIPQDFTDLCLVLSTREATGTDGNVRLSINGNTTSLTARDLEGAGSGTPVSTSRAFIAVVTSKSTDTSSTFGNASIYFPNYTGSTNKSISVDAVSENNGTTAFQSILAGLRSNTDPITSISLAAPSGNIAQYSSATLYGIRKYNTTLAPKASGGIISYDAVNNKWVHVFTASGTFTPTQNLSGVEYLVVAGGGGGGSSINTQGGGGGGGAGGYRSSVTGESSGGGASAESTLSLTASTGYTVTVGAGGAAGSGGTSGSSGSNSVFDSITATGGGGGGAGTAGTNGLSGGSGGGGGYGDGGAGAGGSGTANQGYAGGAGKVGALSVGGGGGGGASEIGNTDGGTYGGDGVSSSITGTALVRAGGGGGGIYDASADNSGAGGGGIGTRANGGPDSTPGIPGTGGGGGGGYSTRAASAGGSGVVIVRYSA